MIHITYLSSRETLFSSGHIFFEIFTVFIFSHLMPGIKPIWNHTWNISKIITQKSFQKNTETPLPKYDKILVINQYHKWESISFQDFLDIKQLILTTEKQYSNILVQLENVCAIHPDVLHLWYTKKLIKNNIYIEKIIPVLKDMYYLDHCKEPINVVGIHIRRGDLLERLYAAGLTMEYYKNLITNINKVLDIPIYIYCESDQEKGTTRIQKNYSNKYNNDYDILKKLKNVEVKLGNLNNFSEQFNELIRCKYLFLSPSGFSLWSAFISSGKILYDKKCVDFRPNLLKNVHILPNFYQYNKPSDILNILNI